MIEPTVDRLEKPQTDSQPGYLGYLLQVAIDFGSEIGVDPGQALSVVELLLSPVDSLE